ncbi:MAG: hypothetical protein QGM50_05985 [Anaerolineae bacterium]|nr:hypothetical protein [Anaerolineae bacterium]
MKTRIFSLLPLILISMACGSTTPQAELEPATISENTISPEPNDGQGANSSPPETATTVGFLSLPDVRIVYIREGNLWLTEESSGKIQNSQLTGTGDMTTVRVSPNGQMLAFMRGREVWTVGMDGLDAKLRATLANENAALWFAPNGALLAVATKDHIELVDLITSISNKVLTYPAITNATLPEVIWVLDSSAFKTVIPLNKENDQAEFLYVFTDGTVASLAKFMIAPHQDGSPYLSPDGGYLIYTAISSDGMESLYLMDSSGATKPYSPSANSVRALGWLNDSTRFVYSIDEFSQAYLGDIFGPPKQIELPPMDKIQWVDTDTYIALENRNLYLGDLNGVRIEIDSKVTDFDIID